MSEQAEPVTANSGTAGKAMNVAAPETSAIVAVYDTHVEAEDAVRALQQSGFDLKQLSIVGKDYHTEETATGYYTTGDRMKAWGTAGAFWGGLWALLFGSAFFIIPGIGPLLAAGPVVAWIVGALESAALVGGVSALGAGLLSVGIPKDSIIAYETQIKAGKFLVIAHGPTDKVNKAHDTFAASNHQGVNTHAACA